LKAIIIELNGSGLRYGYDEKAIHNHFLGLGFSPFKYNPFTRTLNKQYHFGQLNTLYLRDLSFVLQRVESAQKFKVFNQLI
jgi:hypothetical protein